MGGVGMCVVGMRRGCSMFLLNEITNILFRNMSNRVYKGATHVHWAPHYQIDYSVNIFTNQTTDYANQTILISDCHKDRVWFRSV